MKTDAQQAIDRLLKVAENDYISFTCCELDREGRSEEYIKLFSYREGELSFFLSDDPEYRKYGDESFVSDETINAARQEWRRTALCFAVELILDGQL